MDIEIRQEHLNLFEGLENLTLLHISDIHLWYSTTILTSIKKIITTNNPDLIVLTGDYYDIPKGAHNFRHFLLEIGKTHKIVFIKGNHDKIYGNKISKLLNGLPNCFSVENSIYKFESKRGYTYNITSWKNKNNLSTYNSKEKNIILIHNPEKIKDKETSNIQLILAGHLHGGQFIFFKTKNNSNFPGSLLYRHCSDRKKIENTTLIVSKGLGDTFPFRVNCPKEIVKISIK